MPATRRLTAGRPGRERWSSGLALFPGESTGELSSLEEAGHGRVEEERSLMPRQGMASSHTWADPLPLSPRTQP